MSTQFYQNGQTTLIHSTVNYDQFRFDPRNRPINQDHLERLYDAIEKKNLLKEHPIIVSSDGIVRDGQHRLKVAEALKTPIYYIVSDDVTVDDVPGMNSLNRSWKSEDYLHAYCQEGRRDYLMLNDFWRANRDIMTLAPAMSLCNYGDKSGLSIRFQSGEYQCNDLEFAKSVVNAVRDFASYFKYYNAVAFINSIANLMGNADYDHERMMMKMKYLSARLVKCPDMDTYIAVINDIYNYKVPDSRRVQLRKLGSGDKKFRQDRKQKKTALPSSVNLMS